MNIIGIDPGKKGGIAFIRSPLYHQIDLIVFPMPLAGNEIDLAIITSEIEPKLTWIAYIEKAHAMPGQGVTSMFNYGKGYGKLLGMLETLMIPYHLITPQKWKKTVLAGTKKDKASAIEYCRRVYPGINLKATHRSRTYHNGMADALCIADYGKRQQIMLLSEAQGQHLKP